MLRVMRQCRSHIRERQLTPTLRTPPTPPLISSHHPFVRRIFFVLVVELYVSLTFVLVVVCAACAVFRVVGGAAYVLFVSSLCNGRFVFESYAPQTSLLRRVRRRQNFVLSCVCRRLVFLSCVCRRHFSVSFDIISISFGYHLDIMISKLDIIWIS
jgi:hypothetical protein